MQVVQAQLEILPAGSWLAPVTPIRDGYAASETETDSFEAKF